ncbi:DUF4432 family protein [Paramicrobacterium chengjingii]|uniref:DUF4432 family protein n=1 Tax=Paramicrobacterium chengjingii TaxID=2769067 RepID=UPI0014244B30|nr:DUF4432 family protein [Microbacterium chengjingii]
MVRTVRLTSSILDVTVDIDRGMEILSIRHIPTDTEVLMVTPWAEHALTLRPVPATYAAEASEAAWHASYAGGWQTLFPHAGSPEEVDGKMRHYHGEASIVPWVLDMASDLRLEAHVSLNSIPVRLDRVISLEDGSVQLEDRIENLGGTSIRYDYQSHPAFGAPFLERGCRISTDARTYVPHPNVDVGEFEPGVAVDWPNAESRFGETDLAAIPGHNSKTLRLGWLTDFTHRVVTISNPRTGLTADLSWSDPIRKYAWLWQDAGADTREPWNGRGYTTAIEPSTRTTVFEKQDSPVLNAECRVTFSTRLSLHTEKFAAKERAQ